MDTSSPGSTPHMFASMAAKAKVMAPAPRESHSATGPAPTNGATGGDLVMVDINVVKCVYLKSKRPYDMMCHVI